jgi:chromosome segregation ATPase
MNDLSSLSPNDDNSKLSKVISSLKRMLEIKDDQINAKDKYIATQQSTIEGLRLSNMKVSRHFNDETDEITEKKQELQMLEDKNKSLANTNYELKLKLAKLNIENDQKHDKMLDTKDKFISDLKEKNIDLTVKKNVLHDEVNHAKKEIQMTQETESSLIARIHKQESMITERNKSIQGLALAFKKKEHDIDQISSKLKDIEAYRVTEKKALESAFEKKLRESSAILKNSLNEKDNRIKSTVEKLLKDKETL